MTTLYVFGHLGQTDPGFVPAGQLNLTEQGSQVLASEFAYGGRYLDRPEAFEVDPVSLGLADKAAVRMQFLQPAAGLSEFGGIRDAAPDAWGRRVIEARLRAPVNSLPESTYLLQAGSDRVGALDVRNALGSPGLAGAGPIHTLEHILQAAELVQAGLPIPVHLMDVLGAGPTAGGARPKASVRDNDGSLWLAKFPSNGDGFDMARAELCTLELARRCGIVVPALRHLDVGGRSVLLVQRFDRYWVSPWAAALAPQGLLHQVPIVPGAQEHRLPFVSGLTLVGCPEAESPLKGYADLAHAMRRYLHPTCIEPDIESLFARMVFNIFVSNDDDHLRNHGFVRDPRLGGWRLSPLYDVVPRPGVARDRFLHLQVGAQGKAATLDNAMTYYAAFFGRRDLAIAVVRQVWGEVRQWKQVFDAHGATGVLINQMVPAMRELEDIASPELVREIRRSDAQAR
jgi:serine/threonine-protein kinase HipA